MASQAILYQIRIYISECLWYRPASGAVKPSASIGPPDHSEAATGGASLTSSTPDEPRSAPSCPVLRPTATATRLALRELWISSRFLLLLAAYIGAGAVVALVAAPVSTILVVAGVLLLLARGVLDRVDL